MPKTLLAACMVLALVATAATAAAADADETDCVIESEEDSFQDPSSGLTGLLEPSEEGCSVSSTGTVVCTETKAE